MYVNIGGDFLLSGDSIIGIFDLDNASFSRHTKDFLNGHNKRGAVVDLSTDLPGSFLLATDSFAEPIVYLSELSSRTVVKRCR